MGVIEADDLVMLDEVEASDLNARSAGRLPFWSAPPIFPIPKSAFPIWRPYFCHRGALVHALLALP